MNCCKVSCVKRAGKRRQWIYEAYETVAVILAQPLRTTLDVWTELCCVHLRHSQRTCNGNLVCRSFWSLFRPWRVHGCSRKDLHHTVEATTGKTVGVNENQADLQLVPVADDMGTANVHGEPATLSPQPVFDERWYGDAPLCAQYALFHINCSYTNWRHDQCETCEYSLWIPLRANLTATVQLLWISPRFGCTSAYSRNVCTVLQSNYDAEKNSTWV
jgi:hypothetical protein